MDYIIIGETNTRHGSIEEPLPFALLLALPQYDTIRYIRRSTTILIFIHLRQFRTVTLGIHVDLWFRDIYIFYLLIACYP